MNQYGVFMADVMPELTDGFQKGLAFDVSHRAAHLYDGNPRPSSLFPAVETAFDLVGDMGNHLDGSSAVIAPAFFVKNGPVYFSGGYIGILIQTFVDKPLVMPQVKICFRAVVGYKDLSVLYGIHSSRVYVDVGVEFLHSHPVASGF